VRFHLSGTNPDAGILSVSCLPNVRILEISLQFRGGWVGGFEKVDNGLKPKGFMKTKSLG
jgi:hypothetical protein